MKNLRITERTEWRDTYNTGDSHSKIIFEVRRDFEPHELIYGDAVPAKRGQKLPYHQSVIDKGIVLAEFSSEEFAKAFIIGIKLSRDNNHDLRDTLEEREKYVGVSNEELVLWYKNARATKMGAGGHTKAELNEWAMRRHATEIERRYLSIPKYVEGDGEFNGAGAV